MNKIKRAEWRGKNREVKKRHSLENSGPVFLSSFEMQFYGFCFSFIAIIIGLVDAVE